MAEINKASKQGELFSVFGSGKGGNSNLETKSVSLEGDFVPASHVPSVSAGGIDTREWCVLAVCLFINLFCVLSVATTAYFYCNCFFLSVTLLLVNIICVEATA